MSQIEETHIPHARPDRQRSSKVNEDNLKSYLLVDQARYALGMPELGKAKEAKLLHRGFLTLLSECTDATQDCDLAVILQFLNTYASGGEWQKTAPKDVVSKWEKIVPKDVVTFAIDRSTPELYPFERKPVQQFWVRHLEREFVSPLQGQCASCGQVASLLQTLPQEVVLPGRSARLLLLTEKLSSTSAKTKPSTPPYALRAG
jgi:CRISPR-associated protein Csd1